MNHHDDPQFFTTLGTYWSGEGCATFETNKIICKPTN